MAEASSIYEKQTDTKASVHPAQTVFLEKAKLAGEACTRGDFEAAVQLYSEAIELDPENHVLYSNRSAAYIRALEYSRALDDGRRAAELQPNWSKAYYRQGVALQCLGRHAEALAAFASALAQDSKSPQLLTALTEATMKSPLKGALSHTYEQLSSMKLDRSPFVMISVIGQELLSLGHLVPAIGCLEAALKVGTCGLRLRGSVISALSSAYWKLGNVAKAMHYMKQDLETSQSLGDKAGECRAHGNLGGAYYSQKTYKEALENHKQQFDIATALKDRKSAAAALSSLGHVHVSLEDYSKAIASHKQSAQTYKELGDRLGEARELGNVGAVHVLLSEYDQAVRFHQEHLKIATELGDKAEEGRAHSNLGSAYHCKRDYDKAAEYHQRVLEIAKQTKDSFMETRAYAGLGHALRCKGELDAAKNYHERQLTVAVKNNDRATEGRALSNLGIILQQQGCYGQALKLHKSHLAICKEHEDRAAQGRAYGNMGCAYSALGRYDQAIKFHKQELIISQEVNDRASEACTHGNLAVAFQAIGTLDKALKHYQNHLDISRELNDRTNEAVALSNLGNFFSSCADFAKAVPHYEKFLSSSIEMHDLVGECKACHSLGFAHYSLGNHAEAVKYYERNVELAQQLGDRQSVAQAHCNIGLAHSALGNYDRAVRSHEEFLSVSRDIGNVQSEFKACVNIAEIYTTLRNSSQALRYCQEQLKVAESVGDLSMMSDAHGALGNAYRTAGQLEKALGAHRRELELRQQLDDKAGLCKALGNLGTDYSSLRRYSDAFQYYHKQLVHASQIHDRFLEYQAYGNLGITKMNSGEYQEALGFFEQQLAALEQLPSAYLEIGRAHGNLGECYHMLADHDDAVKCFEKYLAAAQQAQSDVDQDKAYRGLGNTHRTVGNLQQALVCYEKRLVVAHDLTDFRSKEAAYEELGILHKGLGNFEQAIFCFEQQLSLAKEYNDLESQSEALSGMGLVQQKMGEYEEALKFHEEELRVARELRDATRQARAFHNLGVTHEIIGNHAEATRFQEQHLSVAAQKEDPVAKAQAYSALGRTHHALGNFTQAISHLRQGLAIAEGLGRTEDEARIRHRLGVSCWAGGQLEEAQAQLYRAANLLEKLRESGSQSGVYRVALYDLQSATYQALQRVLVTQGKHNEALAVAERGRTRDFIDLLQERQGGGRALHDVPRYVNDPLVTPESITELVKNENATVLYYSIAAGHLYSWLITPNGGIVKFHDSLLSDAEHDNEAAAELDHDSSVAYASALLDQYITQVRDALGVEPHLNLNRTTSLSESEVGEDAWERDLVLSSGMASRSYMSADEDELSIASGPSLASTPRSSFLSGRSLRKLNGVRSSSSSKKPGWSAKPPLRALYELLIAPMEDALPASSFENEGSDLALVLQADLYLVPFAVLKGSMSKDCLFRRFRLITVPSLLALRGQRASSRKNTFNASSTLVVGNPKIPTSFDQWDSNPSAEHEAKIVSELFGTKPLLGSSATKAEVVRQLPTADCVHFATHVSWKLSAVILSTGLSESRLATTTTEGDGLDFLGDVSNDETPALSDFLLTAADILDRKLVAKLVVIGAAHNHSSRNRITSDGVTSLTRSFLSAGAQCVLIALWPVPDLACKLLLKAFYGGLLRGMGASHALCQAMHVVQGTKQFSHPSNWAGFMLVGSDVVFVKKELQMSTAMARLLDNPTHCRDALKVLAHLVDKAHQRILQGHRSSMYTAEASIHGKVKGVSGWRELLQSLGFRFQKANNGLPNSVFFPTSNRLMDKLMAASNNLQALLGLSPTTLQALAKLTTFPEVNKALVVLFNEVLTCFTQNMSNVQVPLNIKLWRTSGCHELLASLGFDLIGVGKAEVMLRSGKPNSRRALQCTVQALCGLTEMDNPQEVGYKPLSKNHSASTLLSNLSLKSASMGSDLDVRSHDGGGGRSGSMRSRASARSDPALFRSSRESLLELSRGTSVDGSPPNSTNDLTLTSRSKAAGAHRRSLESLNGKLRVSSVDGSPPSERRGPSRESLLGTSRGTSVDGSPRSSTHDLSRALSKPRVTSVDGSPHSSTHDLSRGASLGKPRVTSVDGSPRSSIHDLSRGASLGKPRVTSVDGSTRSSTRDLSRETLLGKPRVTSVDGPPTHHLAAPPAADVAPTNRRGGSDVALGSRLRTPPNGSVIPSGPKVEYLDKAHSPPVGADHSPSASLPEHTSDSSVDSYSDIVGYRSSRIEPVRSVSQLNGRDGGYGSGSSPVLIRAKVSGQDNKFVAPTSNPHRPEQGRSILRNSLSKSQNTVVDSSRLQPSTRYRSEENFPANKKPQLTNGDVSRARGLDRAPAVNGLDSGRRGQTRSKSVPRATVNSVSSDEESHEPPARQKQRARPGARNPNSSVARALSPSARAGNRPASYHSEMRAPPYPGQGLGQHMNGLHSPQSSIESMDSPRGRQDVAERAAAALMRNHVPRGSHEAAASNRLEMKSLNGDRRKLRKEHLASLTHLHTSSC